MKTTSPLDLVIPSKDDMKLLTFGDMEENTNQFEEKFSGDRTKAKNCKSTVNRCLLKVCLNPLRLICYFANSTYFLTG